MSERAARLLRTSVLLTGDRAEALAASALAWRGDSEAAYFTLYRTFLSRFHRWGRTPWAGRLSRAERAVLVALHHDGWSVEDTADLCGWKAAKVRATSDRALAALGTTPEGLAELFTAADADSDPDGLPRRVRRIRVRRRIVAGICLLAVSLPLVRTLGPSPALLDVQEATTPLSPVLPATTAIPIRFGLRVRDSFPEAAEPWNFPDKRGGCVVVDVTGARWRIPDADGASGVEISQDGRKIAYYSLERRRVVVRELASGAITDVPTDFTMNTLRFSGDGRYLAAQGDVDGDATEVIVIDTEGGRGIRLPSRSSLLAGWAGDRLVVRDGKATVVTLDGTPILTSPVKFRYSDDPGISPDGRSFAVDDPETGLVTLLDIATGKKIRDVRPQLPPTAVLRRLYRWTDANELLIYAPGYGSAAVYLMNPVTGALRAVPYAPRAAAEDLTIGAT
ncbi:TolB-like translocation protein [Microtetraspora malaysiensis]|uniref:Uncharacterized protein n=1 Tax=Microtetraspora malaysiensis TaxID=161358 RepID=A0ABW6SYC7_9ACTN